MPPKCSHLKQITVTSTRKDYCEDCVLTGDTWLHLRMCLICGHVACCDSSPNQHATKHFGKTTHPLIRSIEPGETWVWCYADEVQPPDLDA